MARAGLPPAPPLLKTQPLLQGPAVAAGPLLGRRVRAAPRHRLSRRAGASGGALPVGPPDPSLLAPVPGRGV